MALRDTSNSQPNSALFSRPWIRFQVVETIPRQSRRAPLRKSLGGIWGSTFSLLGMVEPFGAAKATPVERAADAKGRACACVKTRGACAGRSSQLAPQRLSHKRLGGELRRVLADDDRGNDVARERRKAQEARDVTGCDVLLAGNSVQRQLAVRITRSWMS